MSLHWVDVTAASIAALSDESLGRLLRLNIERVNYEARQWHGDSETVSHYTIGIRPIFESQLVADNE